MFLPYSHVPLSQFLFQPLFPILLSLFIPLFEWGSHDEGISHVSVDPFTHRTWVAPSVWAIVPPYQILRQRGGTLPLQSRWPFSNLRLMLDPMFGWRILPRHYPFSLAHSLVNTYAKVFYSWILPLTFVHHGPLSSRGHHEHGPYYSGYNPTILDTLQYSPHDPNFKPWRWDHGHVFDTLKNVFAWRNCHVSGTPSLRP